MADRFDLDAIDADDALLDLLAAGGESARSAGEHDPAVALLAELRLAVEVEDELPVETIDDPESFLARCAALNPITDPFARKVAARGLALGVAAVAALSVSGVAAAVNGDPLSPYEKVIEKMVDAVRPQTSFPKEQLDGMPVVDKTKIVKVAKDYKQRQEAKVAAEDRVVREEPIPPAAVLPTDTPDVLQRALPKIIEQPTVTQVDPPAAETTKAPEKTDDTTTSNPTDPPATQPTDPPATDPTAPPATTDPTTQPPTTDPTTAPPTDPTQDPTTAPPTNPDNGQTGTGNPTTTPSGDTTGSETGTTQPNDTPPVVVPPVDVPSVDVPSVELPSLGAPSLSAPLVEAPSVDAPSVDAPNPLADLVEKAVAPILPSATGAALENETAEQSFGDSVQAAGKHSSGQTATGSVRMVYPTGQHSTGLYAEGKHAAIARAHGSTADADVLQILDVVNAPLQ
ncbi:hypothetical protein OG555_07210 [Kribbella sp. NBC_01484]|uniref:hypothetical protein n=1 Tax=Kribbella sp. NBC_01484 TaxID=2903579 RepID=UPI002E3513DB|nr:hypothetical protein [Kribbella sp. NBC_01484]